MRDCVRKRGCLHADAAFAEAPKDAQATQDCLARPPMHLARPVGAMEAVAVLPRNCARAPGTGAIGAMHPPCWRIT